MTFTFITLTLLALTSDAPAAENPVFKELLEKGVKVSDGTAFRLPPPVMADGLDAAGQRAAMEKVADARSSPAELVKKSSFAPVVVKVRTLKPAQDEGPAVRSIDLWFVAHGDWEVLNSKDFLESALKTNEEGKSQVVLKSGVLTDKEVAARKLSAVVKDGYEERFVYSTIALFDRVQLSATRFAVSTKGKETILAAGRLDPRFAKDPDYPNQWRPLLRDAQADITPGPAHPFAHAGGYAKITRLRAPAGAVFVECHMVYEEDYGWFDGANLVKQKVPLMVQEKVRTFRRKLALASGEKAGKKSPERK